jgi:hypothetical protein
MSDEPTTLPTHLECEPGNSPLNTHHHHRIGSPMHPFGSYCVRADRLSSRPRVPGQLTLRLNRSADRIRRGREHHEEAVPLVPISVPPWAAHASRSTLRWASSASAYAGPRRLSSSVEPSMSENNIVTVPVGNSAMTT